jgi:SprT-like family
VIYFRCGHCAGVVRAGDDDVGRPILCRRCGQSTVCPEALSRPSAAAPVESGSHGTRALALAALFVVVSLGWVLWRALETTAADAAPAPALSAADRRQQELLRDDLAKPSDPELLALYRTINQRHFAGRLPDMPVQWEPRLMDVGALASQRFTLEGMFGHMGDRAAILLNASLRSDPAALRRALCHEMVHAYLYEIGDTSTDHGPAFQTELKRLSAEGAFEGIVATDADREAQRAWLDREAVRLDADSEAVRREGEDIERERVGLEEAMADMNARIGAAAARGERFSDTAAVETLNARRDAYNRRVEETNRRTEEGRAALAEFNRQVERYNLMLSYPDGVEEDGLRTPKPATQQAARQ